MLMDTTNGILAQGEATHASLAEILASHDRLQYYLLSLASPYAPLTADRTHDPPTHLGRTNIVDQPIEDTHRGASEASSNQLKATAVHQAKITDRMLREYTQAVDEGRASRRLTVVTSIVGPLSVIGCSVILSVYQLSLNVSAA